MEKGKVRVVGEKYIEKMRKVLSVFETKGVRMEVEPPVSNQELVLEIKKNIKVLNLLTKEAKKRGLVITSQVGLIGVPTDLTNLNIRIYEYKEY